MTDTAASPRSTVRRLPDRGAYDAPTLQRILGEGLLCHVGIVQDGQPFTLPMAFGVDEEFLYLHGSSASRLMKTIASGAPISVAVSLIDGLVLARSAFHHSMNYRSVMVLGAAEELTQEADKLRALKIISDHVIDGRYEESRAPTEIELKATMVARLPLKEASAKIRTGPPVDDAEDLDFPVWAGVLPMRRVFGPPISETPDHEVPKYVAEYSRENHARPG